MFLLSGGNTGGLELAAGIFYQSSIDLLSSASCFPSISRKMRVVVKCTKDCRRSRTGVSSLVVSGSLHDGWVTLEGEC